MALQTIGGVVSSVLNLDPLGPSSYHTLDYQNEAVGFIFQIPKTGTLTDIAFATGTVTTGSDYTIRIETVNTSPGYPTGTLYDANGTGSGTIADANDNTILSCNINDGTGISVTKGNVVAVVLTVTSASPNLRINAQPSGVTFAFPYMALYTGTPPSAWAMSACRPSIALNIGGWCNNGLTPFCQSVTSESITAGYERGVLMNFPYKCRITGAAMFLSGYAKDIKLVIYSDPTGDNPVAELTSDRFYGEIAGANTSRLFYYLFDSTFIPIVGVDYALAIQGIETGAYLSYWSYPNNTYTAAYPLWPSWVWCGRNGTSGAFTLTDTRVPMLSPLIDQLDDGASAGGGAINLDKMGAL